MLEVYKPQLATIETWGGWSTLRSVSIALGCTEVAQVLDHAPYLERIRGVMIDTFARPGRFAAVSDLAVLDVMATEAELATLRRFEKLRHFGAWLSELRTLDFCEHAQ